MINGLVKAGYLLIGAGIGIFASSFILAHEFDKPIGEIEEFIPEDGYDISDDQEDGSEDSWGNSYDSSEDSTDILQGRDGRDGRVAGNRGAEVHGSGERNGGEEVHQEFQSNQAQILDYYTSSEGHIQERRMRRERNEEDKSSKHSARRKAFDKCEKKVTLT